MTTSNKTLLTKKILRAVLILLVGANVAILVTGNTYLYKTLYYNFANIDDENIFSSRMVKNGTPQPWAIAADYNKAKLPDSVLAEMEKLETVSYLVIKNDSIKYEQYWDGYNEKSQSNSFSMAKSVISLLIGIAHDEGKIKSFDEPICNYLPDYCAGQAAKCTIRDLLMMSSGSSWDESYANIFSVTTKAYYGNDLKKLFHDDVKIESEPGKYYHYKSGDSQMLAFILEKATGQTVADYASEKLWSRVGAEQSAPWSLDHKDGHEKAYCCFYSGARDFARIGKLMLDSGSWNGTQIVSKDFVKEATTPNGLFYYHDPDTLVYTYGLQWWLMNYKGHNIFYMQGMLGQYVFVIPDERMIVVRLGKHREKEKHFRRPMEVDYLIQGALTVCGEK